MKTINSWVRGAAGEPIRDGDLKSPDSCRVWVHCILTNKNANPCSKADVLGGMLFGGWGLAISQALALILELPMSPIRSPYILPEALSTPSTKP